MVWGSVFKKVAKFTDHISGENDIKKPELQKLSNMSLEGIRTPDDARKFFTPEVQDALNNLENMSKEIGKMYYFKSHQLKHVNIKEAASLIHTARELAEAQSYFLKLNNFLSNLMDLRESEKSPEDLKMKAGKNLAESINKLGNAIEKMKKERISDSGINHEAYESNFDKFKDVLVKAFVSYKDQNKSRTP